MAAGIAELVADMVEVEAVAGIAGLVVGIAEVEVAVGTAEVVVDSGFVADCPS